MDFQAMLETFKDAIAADLPARLRVARLPDFEEYLADTPRDTEIRQLGVILGTGEITMDRLEQEIIIHADLPRINRPTDHLGHIIASVQSIRPRLLGYQTLEGIEHLSLYPGMPPEGGSGSFIQLSIIYTKDLDDCD